MKSDVPISALPMSLIKVDTEVDTEMLLSLNPFFMHKPTYEMREKPIEETSRIYGKSFWTPAKADQSVNMNLWSSDFLFFVSFVLSCHGNMNSISMIYVP